MTVLFGSVEYFKKEIKDALSEKLTTQTTEDEQLQFIYTELENDIMNNFVCDEIVKKECIENLQNAFENFLKVSIP